MLEQITLMFTDHMIAGGFRYMLDAAGYDAKCSSGGCTVIVNLVDGDDVIELLKLVGDAIV